MDELDYEKQYWNTCVNTFVEDQKHYVYAKYMGLPQEHFSFNVFGKRILDIGGGPSSILLKCINLKEGLVIDPIDFPQWTKDRYKMHNVSVKVDYGENVLEKDWDEVWIYNCLQHTHDPKKIIRNALDAGKIVRIFEWIDIPAHEGHPHELTKDFLIDCFHNSVNKGYGVVDLAESGCFGKAFFGVFYKAV